MLTRMSPFHYRGCIGVATPFRGVPSPVTSVMYQRSKSGWKLPTDGAVSRRFFGSYIESYYTTNHASTGFSTPLRKNFAFMVFIFQAVFTFGYLFHTNYYFTGKALPKPDGSTQLCSDSK
ncbi:hypothetical protein BgAZ_304330 [Babesia gibsoni]|uniref:Uncharacterized protein n=1 Tax=Babesia gibsoni TaxID=33632 RepID=A0AAD8LSE6_BABGI|nr:hypothetical protein BgAZ_304330 [Babesia gibsoni]